MSVGIARFSGLGLQMKMTTCPVLNIVSVSFQEVGKYIYTLKNAKNCHFKVGQNKNL